MWYHTSMTTKPNPEPLILPASVYAAVPRGITLKEGYAPLVDIRTLTHVDAAIYNGKALIRHFFDIIDKELPDAKDRAVINTYSFPVSRVQWSVEPSLDRDGNKVHDRRIGKRTTNITFAKRLTAADALGRLRKEYANLAKMAHASVILGDRIADDLRAQANIPDKDEDGEAVESFIVTTSPRTAGDFTLKVGPWREDTIEHREYEQP